MKYILRLLAILPALGVGISMIILFVSAFDYKWMILPCILDILAFIYLLDNMENMVKNIKEIGKTLLDKTPVYD